MPQKPPTSPLRAGADTMPPPPQPKPGFWQDYLSRFSNRPTPFMAMEEGQKAAPEGSLIPPNWVERFLPEVPVNPYYPRIPGQPLFTPQQTLAKMARGAAVATGENLAGLTTPRNLEIGALMALTGPAAAEQSVQGLLIKFLHKMAEAGLGAEMGYNLYKQREDIRQAVNSGDPETAMKVATSVLQQGGMATGMVAGGTIGMMKTGKQALENVNLSPRMQQALLAPVGLGGAALGADITLPPKLTKIKAEEGLRALEPGERKAAELDAAGKHDEAQTLRYQLQAERDKIQRGIRVSKGTLKVTPSGMFIGPRTGEEFKETLGGEPSMFARQLQNDPNVERLPENPTTDYTEISRIPMDPEGARGLWREPEDRLEFGKPFEINVYPDPHPTKGGKWKPPGPRRSDYADSITTASFDRLLQAHRDQDITVIFHRPEPDGTWSRETYSVPQGDSGNTLRTLLSSEVRNNPNIWLPLTLEQKEAANVREPLKAPKIRQMEGRGVRALKDAQSQVEDTQQRLGLQISQVQRYKDWASPTTPKAPGDIGPEVPSAPAQGVGLFPSGETGVGRTVEAEEAAARPNYGMLRQEREAQAAQDAMANLPPQQPQAPPLPAVGPQGGVHPFHLAQMLIEAGFPVPPELQARITEMMTGKKPVEVPAAAKEAKTPKPKKEKAAPATNAIVAETATAATAPGATTAAPAVNPQAEAARTALLSTPTPEVPATPAPKTTSATAHTLNLGRQFGKITYEPSDVVADSDLWGNPQYHNGNKQNPMVRLIHKVPGEDPTHLIPHSVPLGWLNDHRARAGKDPITLEQVITGPAEARLRAGQSRGDQAVKDLDKKIAAETARLKSIGKYEAEIRRTGGDKQPASYIVRLIKEKAAAETKLRTARENLGKLERERKARESAEATKKLKRPTDDDSLIKYVEDQQALGRKVGIRLRESDPAQGLKQGHDVGIIEGIGYGEDNRGYPALYAEIRYATATPEGTTYSAKASRPQRLSGWTIDAEGNVLISKRMQGYWKQKEAEEIEPGKSPFKWVKKTKPVEVVHRETGRHYLVDPRDQNVAPMKETQAVDAISRKIEALDKRIKEVSEWGPTRQSTTTNVTARGLLDGLKEDLGPDAVELLRTAHSKYKTEVQTAMREAAELRSASDTAKRITEERAKTVPDFIQMMHDQPIVVLNQLVKNNPKIVLEGLQSLRDIYENDLAAAEAARDAAPRVHRGRYMLATSNRPIIEDLNPAELDPAAAPVTEHSGKTAAKVEGVMTEKAKQDLEGMKESSPQTGARVVLVKDPKTGEMVPKAEPAETPATMRSDATDALERGKAAVAVKKEGKELYRGQSAERKKYLDEQAKLRNMDMTKQPLVHQQAYNRIVSRLETILKEIDEASDTIAKLQSGEIKTKSKLGRETLIARQEARIDDATKAFEELQKNLRTLEETMKETDPSKVKVKSSAEPIPPKPGAQQ